MLNDYSRNRTANAILYFAARTSQCTKSKLMHLLYLLDFEHFKVTGRSVTGHTYCALPSGPAPAQLYWEFHRPEGLDSYLEDLVVAQSPVGPDAVLLPQSGFVDDDLTHRQIALLARLATEFGADRGEVLRNAVCAAGGPWHRTYSSSGGHLATIPYELILDGLPNRGAILESAREHQQFRRSFSVR